MNTSLSPYRNLPEWQWTAHNLTDWTDLLCDPGALNALWARLRGDSFITPWITLSRDRVQVRLIHHLANRTLGWEVERLLPTAEDLHGSLIGVTSSAVIPEAQECADVLRRLGPQSQLNLMLFEPPDLDAAPRVREQLERLMLYAIVVTNQLAQQQLVEAVQTLRRERTVLH